MSTAADAISLDPGSDAWLREMTASKVAAVLGLSPWESRFSLWYRMKGIAPEDSTAQEARYARGHYFEDGVARFVADAHGIAIAPGGTWRNRARPWQVASPDRRAVTPRGTAFETLGVVEVKTDAGDDHGRWGPDGSDEVPIYYRAQAVWQCDTLGVPVAYMGVVLPRFELRAYTVRPAPGEAEFIREECRAFLDSLAANEPPDVDKHSATYDTLRVLHPGIAAKGEDEYEVEVPRTLAQAYARSVGALRAAEDEYNLRRNELAAYMGRARLATYDGRKLALRQPGPTGTPYPKAGDKKVLAAIASEESTDE